MSKNKTLTFTSGTRKIKQEVVYIAKSLLATEHLLSIINRIFKLNQLHYTYCADSNKWELNTALESNRSRYKMFSDGGNSIDYYEVGSNLSLIANTGGSCEY